ncbi:hypothetical protein GmHk_18G051791 [Glycine max]|nr:hypothetical protein GmHk_18G051791 [Glycine max]
MAINIFVLPKAMVGLTLLDVVAILNLPLHDELLSLYGTSCVPSTTLAIKFSKDDSGYSKFMLLNAKKSVVKKKKSKRDKEKAKELFKEPSQTLDTC